MENKEKKINKGQILKGKVVSEKMDKTIVVAVSQLKTHPKYGKRYLRTKKYKAHDENKEYKTGDYVLIRECRPVSKTKSWEAISRSAK